MARKSLRADDNSILRLNVQNAPTAVFEDEVNVGDIYKVKGGRRVEGQTGSRFQLVVAISAGGYCYMLTFDESGEITGTDRAMENYLDRREKVGRMRGELPLLEVDWF